MKIAEHKNTNGLWIEKENVVLMEARSSLDKIFISVLSIYLTSSFGHFSFEISLLRRDMSRQWVCKLLPISNSFRRKSALISVELKK